MFSIMSSSPIISPILSHAVLYIPHLRSLQFTTHLRHTIMIMSTHSRPNLRRILSDTWRIISAHPGHFSALSILFLLPIYSLSAIIYTFLFLHPSSGGGQFLRKSQITITIILYVGFVLLFAVCANASITHSTFHGFYGKPMVLTSSLDSIQVSFFPLLATHLAAKIIEGLIVFGFCVSLMLAYKGLHLFGLEKMDDKNLVFFLIIVLIAAFLLAAAMIYLLIFRWYLATPVVVVESQWGLAALKRSGYLVKGVREVVFPMIVVFGILFGISSMWYWSLVANARRNVSWELFVVQMIVCVGFWSMLSLCSTASTTVLFVHCKSALHGGVEMAAFQMDDDDDDVVDKDEEEEFGDRDYIRLPFD